MSELIKIDGSEPIGPAINTKEQLLAELDKLEINSQERYDYEFVRGILKLLLRTKNKETLEVLTGVTVDKLIEQNKYK